MNFIKSKPKIENSKPLQRQNRKLLYAVIILGSSLMAWLVFSTMYFIDTHDFRTPVIFQNPMPVKEIKIISPIGSPSATPTPVKEAMDVHKIVQKIYGLESTWGKNDSCREQNKWNGYGFGQNTFVWNCFDSFEIVTSKVVAWVEDKLEKNYTLPELLCYYNKGIKTEDCEYYKNYLTLK